MSWASSPDIMSMTFINAVGAAVFDTFALMNDSTWYKYAIILHYKYNQLILPFIDILFFPSFWLLRIMLLDLVQGKMQ